MFYSAEELLLAQGISTLIVLFLFGWILAVKGLFNWTTMGFWSWISLAIYFALNPLASIKWNIGHYKFYLSISGGLDRGEWIWIVSLSGIISFFLAYISCRSYPVFWRIQSNHFNSVMQLIRLGCAIIAVISFFQYRSFTGSHSQNFSIIGGRFVGQITGYAYGAHLFIFFVVVSLLLSKSRVSMLIAWLLGIGYVVLSMQAIWSRFATVSMIIALSLTITLQKKRKWPSMITIFLLFLLVGVLILRGHDSLESSQGVLDTLSRVPNQIGTILSSGDTSMLASWYAESYVKDKITGYDFELPLINYVFFGAIPGRVFPQKYFLVDWLHSKQPPITDLTLINSLYGAKSSLFGSFYANGGVVGVILYSMFFGFLCRRIDGMLCEESPLIVKSIGICILSVLWMVWGSSDYWGVMTIGTLALPAVLIWVFSPKNCTPISMQ